MQDNNMINSPLRIIREKIEQTGKKIYQLEHQVEAKNAASPQTEFDQKRGGGV